MKVWTNASNRWCVVAFLTRMWLAAWPLSVLLFILGCASGAAYTRPTVNSVNEWLDGKSVADQYDFLEARLKFLPGARRQIAESWCAINEDTQGVCRRARNHAALVDITCHRADGCPTTVKYRR